jgi:hypothetical protein
MDTLETQEAVSTRDRTWKNGQSRDTEALRDRMWKNGQSRDTGKIKPKR